MKGEHVLKKFLLLVGLVYSLNVLFASFLNAWVTPSDMHGLPHDKNGRLFTLFYFAMTTFTTTGYGDVIPRTRMLQLMSSMYMLFVYAFVVTFVTHYYA